MNSFTSVLSSILWIFAVVLDCGQTQYRDPTYGPSRKSPIAYGGVLNKKLPTSSNNTDVLKAAQFGLTYIKKRSSVALPLNEDGEVHPQYVITAPKKLKLIYTADDREPLQTKVRRSDGSVITRSLIWGYTYYFSVSWDTSISPWQHNFIITHYWDDNLYIFAHTFHKKSGISQDSVAADLPSSKTLNLQSRPVLFEGESHLSTFTSSAAPSCHSVNPFLHSSQCHKDEYSSLPQSIYTSNLQHCESETTSHSHHSTSSEQNVFTLKILTYNIWNMNSLTEGQVGYTKRIKRLAKACLSANADIIAFQEVRFQDGKGGTLGPNQVQHLADYLPQYQFVYHPAQIQTDGLPKRVEEGVAIFSKFPIVAQDYLLLTRNPKDNADGHQRILLHAEIKLPTSETVHIFNTHLSLSHKARAVSVVEIWRHMQKFEGPSFLMGDFNAEAHNREVEFLAGEEEINGLRTEGLRDSWKVKYGIQHLGYTFNTLEDELTKRIDLLFFRELPNVSLGDITLLDDGGRNIQAASDHLGLLGTYLIKSYS